MSIGRNDPCPCGSGLKYKRCCQNKDQKEQLHQTAGEDRSRLIPPPGGGGGKGWTAQQAKLDAARAHRDAQRELEQARAASKAKD